MSKRGPRAVEFVCCALIENKAVSKAICNNTSEEAIETFKREFGVEPDNIYGPYFCKRTRLLDNSREIEFSGQRIKGIYKDWFVVASILKHPKNSAFLLFDKRVDNKKAAKPTGTFIIKLEDIEEIK